MNRFITIVGLLASAAATVAAAGACECVTDLNDDGFTNGADMGVLLGAWGTPGGPSGADVNDDGTVDGADLSTLLGAWGPCAAPENDDCGARERRLRRCDRRRPCVIDGRRHSILQRLRDDERGADVLRL